LTARQVERVTFRRCPMPEAALVYIADTPKSIQRFSLRYRSVSQKQMTAAPSDQLLKSILRETKTIACVGVSVNQIRPSYFVARYLSLKGFRVIPVNPVYAGQMLFAEQVRADLASIPSDIKIDFLDLFRRSEHVLAIVTEALDVLPDLKTVWMQIGVENAEAASLAQSRGLQVIQNRCPKIEYQRLFGELRMGGFNTGIISSKL